MLLNKKPPIFLVLEMKTKIEDKLNTNAIRLNYINARNIVSRNIQKAFEENVLF